VIPRAAAGQGAAEPKITRRRYAGQSFRHRPVFPSPFPSPGVSARMGADKDVLRPAAPGMAAAIANLKTANPRILMAWAAKPSGV